MKSILLVEDEQLLVQAAERRLVGEGYSVSVARDGNAALAWLSEHQPDLILLDIVLPELDGISVLTQIRKNEKIKKIPVLLLTNVSDADSIQRGMAAGANGYLVKVDYSLDQVVAKINTYFV